MKEERSVEHLLPKAPWATRLFLGLAAAEGLGSFAVYLVRPASPVSDVAAGYPAARLIMLAVVILGTALFAALLLRSWRDPHWADAASQRVFGDERTVPYALLIVGVFAVALAGAAIYFWPEEVDRSLKRETLRQIWPLGTWVALMVVQLGGLWIWLCKPKRLTLPRRTSEAVALVVLFGVSLGVRVPMTGYGLPYQSVWDEVVTYPQAMRMLTAPGLEQISDVPGYGRPAYGDLLVYVTTVGEVVGLLDGFRTQQIGWIGEYVAPPRGVHSIYEAVHVSGIPLRDPRVLLAALNSLAPLGIFLILRKHLEADTWLAFGGASIFALLSRDVIYYSSYILPDALAATLFVFLILAAFEGMGDDRDRLVPWAACAALAGMIVSVTIRDLPVVLVPLGAFILARNRERPYSKMAIIGLGTFAGFALTSPYALLGLPGYLTKITSFTWAQDFTIPHRLRSVIYYFQGAFASGFDSGYVDSTEGSVGLGGLTALLALIGVAGGLARFPRKVLLILGYSAIHLYSISSVVAQYTRHALLLYPLACLLAGVGLSFAAERVRQGLKRIRGGKFGPRRRIASVLVLLVFLGLSTSQVGQTLMYVQRVSRFQPSQVRMAEYLGDHLQPGDKVGILDQIPWVEADLVERGISFERIGAGDRLADLREQGFTHVVGSDRFGGDYEALAGNVWGDYYSMPGAKLAEYGNMPLQYQGYPNGSPYLFVGRIPETSP